MQQRKKKAWQRKKKVALGEGTKPREEAPGFGRWHKASGEGTRLRKMAQGLGGGHQASEDVTKPRVRAPGLERG